MENDNRRMNKEAETSEITEEEKCKGRFHRKRPALFKSGQWHFHQNNAPVHNSILVTDNLTKMDINTVRHPRSLWLLVIPKAQTLSIWDNWGGCDESHWYAYTRGFPWGLPEVVGTVQQVHCSRRGLLRRGLEFQVCTINKSAHTKKVWKLI